MPPKKDAPKKKASAPAKLMSGGKKAVEEKAAEEKAAEEKDKKKNIIQEGIEFIVRKQIRLNKAVAT